MIVPDKFDMLKWLSTYPECLLIFDEAEEVFIRYALDLKMTGFAGLAAAKRNQVYFYTATFSEYWKKVFMAIFDTDITSIDTFQT